MASDSARSSAVADLLASLQNNWSRSEPYGPSQQPNCERNEGACNETTCRTPSPAKSAHTNTTSALCERYKGVCSPALMLAAEAGHADTVQQLVEEDGKDPSATDAKGVTPLMKAALRGNDDVVRFLLHMGVDVNAACSNGRSALHFSIAAGYLACSEALLQGGADPRAKGLDGNTVLHVAARNGSCEACWLLLKETAKWKEESPLRVSDEVVALINAKNAAGMTPLMLAAKGHHTRCMSLLMKNHADTDSVLLWAVNTGQWRAVELLMSEGAKKNVRDSKGSTLLHMAVEKGFKGLCRILINYGADLEARDGNGFTPLELANQKKDAGIGELLRANVGDDFSHSTSLGSQNMSGTHGGPILTPQSANGKAHQPGLRKKEKTPKEARKLKL